MPMFRRCIAPRAIFLCLALFLSILSLTPLAALASIVDTGDVVESGGVLDIGNTVYGKRHITGETVSYTATHLGNSPGVRGELLLWGSQYTNANELIVGKFGEGWLQNSNSSIQTDTAIVGDAGHGEMNADQMQTTRLTLGAQAEGTGVLNGSCYLSQSLKVIGDAPVLIVGDYGTGTLNLVGNGPGCQYSSEWFVVQGTTPDVAQSYVARKPGSTGTINLNAAARFGTYGILRIGLDELDQPGGIGAIKMFPEWGPTEQFYPWVTATLTKIGPQGSLELNTDPENRSFSWGVASSVSGNVENWGTIKAAALTGISGNLVNRGNLTGISAGIVDQSGMISEQGLTVHGNYTQTTSGQQTVTLEAGLMNFNVLGKLTVEGSAHLDGTLNVTAGGNEGDQYSVLSVPSGNATYEPGFQINFDTSVLNPALMPVADISPTGIIVRIVTNSSVSADLALGMTDTPDPVFQGQTVNYTMSVTNNGPSPATSVAVNGTLSSCFFSNIASGANATCTRTATATAMGTLTQTMSVSGNEPDPNTTNNSASTSTTVNPAANLGIAMTDTPDPVLQGQTVSYDITVTNNGPSPATGVVVSGSLPGCMLGNIAPGATAGCTQTATATSVGTLTQTMTVSGNEADPNTANNSATASTTVNPAADLALSMTDTPDPVKKGAKLVYTLTVVNNGPGSANNVSLTNTLPADIVFVSAVPSQGTCSGKATVTCAIGALGNGAIATVTITVKPRNVGTITNNASVTGAENDPNTANNSASATTVVKR